MKCCRLFGIHSLIIFLILVACATEREEEAIYFEINQSVIDNFQSNDGQGTDSETVFNKGDIIGLFLTEQGTQFRTDSYLYNQPCVFDNNRWTLDKRLSFSADKRGKKMSIVAYYPYTQSIKENAVLPFEVSMRQYTTEEQEKSDLLLARQTYSISEVAADIRFSHLMSQVTFQVNYTNGMPDICSDIYLKAHNRCSVNLETGVVNVQGSAVNVETMNMPKQTSDKSSKQFRLLIPPQQISDKQAIALRINGNPVFMNLEQSFESGRRYTIHLTVFSDKQVSFDGISIDDWQSVDVTQGELYSPKTYLTGDVIVYQKMRENHPVTLVVTGDGFTTNELTPDGLFENRAREALDCLFSVEPYKSYREFFNVYILPTVSNETGAGNTDTGIMKDTYFKTSWGENYSDMQVKDFNEIFNFVSSTCPDIIENKTTIEKVPVFLLVNDSRYGGICWTWNNGQCYAVIPLTEGNLQWSSDPSLGISNGDWKNVFVHEGGGHGFGKLQDEYHSGLLNYTDETIGSHTWEVPFGLNLTTDYNNMKGSVYWKHLLNDTRYPRTGFFEGGMGYERGIWHSEIISCMDDNRLYYNTISRQLIVERIKSITGEPFSLDEFFYKDINFDPLRDFNPSKIGVLNPPIENVRSVPRTPHPRLME